MGPESIKQIAEKTLVAAFDKFSSKGVLSLYLWGSILRDDWDPEISDVDALALLDDSATPDIQDELKAYVKEHAPEIRDFGVQVLYKSELDGAAPRTFMARVMPRSVNHMLLMFPDFKHVAGARFERSDFSEEDMSISEEVNGAIQSAKEKLEKLDDPSRNIRKDLVKNILWLAYFRAWQQKGRFPLNYNSLRDQVLPEDSEIIELITDARHRALYNDKTHFDQTIIPEVKQWLSKVS